MNVPRHSIQFLQVGDEITCVALVCEDLVQDDVAEVIRSVGPTIVLVEVRAPASCQSTQGQVGTSAS